MTRRRLPADPEQQNDDRSAWAEIGLRSFAEATGLKPEVDGWETVTLDLLGDIAHFCDRHKLALGDLLRQAEAHYRAETIDDNTNQVTGDQIFSAVLP